MNLFLRLAFPALLFLFLGKTTAQNPDTAPPVLHCKNLVQVPIFFPCVRTLWATDLIDSVSDDSPGPVELGLRKACTGSGFPEDQTYAHYQSSEWGYARAEVWARDAAGNAASCLVQLNIFDVTGSCDPIVDIRVQLPSTTKPGIDSVRIRLSGSNCLGDTLADYPWPIFTENGGRWMTYGGLVTPGYNTAVTPTKTMNPANGISTADLASIQSHILGNKPLDSPYKILAADVNLDGKVSTYDIILLRKLVLGLIPELPHGQSWRFVPANYVFPDPANPFSPMPPAAAVVPSTLEYPVNSFYFFGVKIGDVNFSADPEQ